jgi:O-antigen ligase
MTILNKISTEQPIKILILIFIFILPWDFFKSIVGVFSFFIVILWILTGKQNGYFIKIKKIFQNKALLLFYIFILYAYFSLFWTEDISAGLKELNFYKYYFVILPIVFTVFNKEDVKTAFYILVFSFGCYALFSLSIFLEFIEIKDSTKLNPKGILSYAIVTVCMAINTFFAFYFYLIEKNNMKIKYLFFTISIISFFVLFVNNGRIGQISFFCTLLILIFYYRKYLFVYKKLLLAIILSFILGVVLLNSFGKLERFKKGFNELGNLKETQFSGSWGHRAYMWYAAGDNISKYPVFGSGVGDNISEFKKYAEKYPSKATWLNSYHNQHLDYLTKFGILGYFIFVSSIFVLLKILYEKNKEFFPLGLIFFSVVLIDSMGDIILLMKPFNNIYGLVFVLLSILDDN